MQKGDILKFSGKGLDWLDGGDAGTRAKLSLRRFEYRCRDRRNIGCLSVKPLDKNYYQHYHKTFLELTHD